MLQSYNRILLSHKKNAVLIHATTWINQNRQIHRDRTQIDGCLRLRVAGGEQKRKNEE